VASGCAHGEIRGDVYRAPEDRYEVRIPPGAWDRLEMDGVDLALTSADRGMTILTGTLCGRYSLAGLDALAGNLFLEMRDRDIREREDVALPAGTARRLLVSGRVDDTAVHAESYTLKNPPCVFDFVYLAAPDRFDGGIAAFRSMMRTLRLLPGEKK
jgi:hypothetical protein